MKGENGIRKETETAEGVKIGRVEGTDLAVSVALNNIVCTFTGSVILPALFTGSRDSLFCTATSRE